jgi:hypothetical protein
MSCELVEEGVYTNCSDKEPEEIKLNNQDLEEEDKKIIEISPDNGKFGLNSYNLLSKELFYSKYKEIMWRIISIISIITFIIDKCKNEDY